MATSSASRGEPLSRSPSWIRSSSRTIAAIGAVPMRAPSRPISGASSPLGASAGRPAAASSRSRARASHDLRDQDRRAALRGRGDSASHHRPRPVPMAAPPAARLRQEGRRPPRTDLRGLARAGPGAQPAPVGANRARRDDRAYRTRKPAQARSPAMRASSPGQPAAGAGPSGAGRARHGRPDRCGEPGIGIGSWAGAVPPRRRRG